MVRACHSAGGGTHNLQLAKREPYFSLSSRLSLIPRRHYYSEAVLTGLGRSASLPLLQPQSIGFLCNLSRSASLPLLQLPRLTSDFCFVSVEVLGWVVFFFK